MSTEPVDLLSGRRVSLDEAVQIGEIDPIIKRFGTWAVTEYGVECLTTHYAIPKARLKEEDWHKHMIGKTWTVAEDVCEALDFARQYFSRKVVNTPKIPETPTPGLPRRPRRQSLSNRLRFLILKRDHYACQMCGRTALQGYQLQIDHKLARKNGGSDELENLWTLCSLCNNGKGIESL